MNESDKREFRDVVTATMDMYGREVSAPVLRLWWAALEPFSIEEVRQGLTRFMRSPDSGGFPPKPADVIKMIQGSSDDTALRAWSDVDYAIRHVGTYRSVAFGDAITMRVIEEMGGWIALGTKTEDEWPFVAREFQTRYRGYRTRSERPECSGVLLGIADAENSRRGLPMQSVTLVGNHEAARAIAAKGSAQAPRVQLAQQFLTDRSSAE